MSRINDVHAGDNYAIRGVLSLFCSIAVAARSSISVQGYIISYNILSISNISSGAS